MGVPTGFIDLDKLLGGLQPSDLIIIAGRPGQGKTALMLSLALHAGLEHKKHVAVFTLEMSNEQVAQRLIAQQTGIDSQRLRNGKLAEEEWPLFTHSIEVLSDTRIFMDDTPALTPIQIRTKCRRLHMEYGLDLVIVDYLQLMTGDTRNDNRVQEVSYISRSLKVLARELNVPVVAAAQLSRAVEQRTGKEPQLSDLRESGCLTGDTLVTLADSGCHVPIRELEGREKFDIWALNPANLKLEPMPVNRAFTTGVKPVYKLITRLGRTIRATANHRFLTIHGWKRLDELMADDYVALPRLVKMNFTHRQAEGSLCGIAEGFPWEASSIDCGFAPTAQPSLKTKFAPVTQHSAFSMINDFESDIIWDSIESILPDGEEPVYDLTVPGHHNFIANNIIVHNSLEQDADIVMFIHRPEEYAEDELRKNIVQIKISKHRNGPVGQVELIFRSALAKFENAATRRVDLGEM
jgi:replicative DNA helicase